MDLNNNGWMLDDWPIWVLIVAAVVALIFYLAE
jgi:hypothetical protein